MNHHSNQEPVCPLCSEKLEQAHPYLRKWFETVKRRHPHAHVAWAFRDKETQNRFLKEKKSKLPWPLSKHNHMLNGKPCALALDLFQIDERGNDVWDEKFYAQVNADNELDRAQLEWAGRWHSFKETCHFQMLQSALDHYAAE